MVLQVGYLLLSVSKSYTQILTHCLRWLSIKEVTENHLQSCTLHPQAWASHLPCS